MKKLNFCCGIDIKNGWDNCDWQKGKNVIPCNADKFPYPFKKNTYEYILLRQCFNFFNYPRETLEELHRISKNNGIIEIIVPHYTNKGAYTDLDSKRFFNDQSFIKFVEGNCRINPKKLFIMQKLEMKPTIVGKFFPRFMREKLSLFINGLIGEMYIFLKVIK